MSKKNTSRTTRVSFHNAVVPASRKDIARIAHDVRQRFGLEGVIYFPAVECLEFMLGKLIPNYDYEIVPIEDMPDKEGDTIIIADTITIKIREDVYENAIKGDGRSRFTIMHEVGHVILHSYKGGPIKKPRVYKSKSHRRKIKLTNPIYSDPEWQADAFAGEILMDSRLIGQLSVEEISGLCGTSRKAARVQYDKLHQNDTVLEEQCNN